MSYRQASTDYERVERAIRFLDENVHDQPELGDLADHLHLSASHVQRLFSRWAGISPKRFLQFLTTEHAKRLLDESRSVLDVTYEAGLSNPSRLHNLLVQSEGVSPGEHKSRGEGLRISVGFHDSPFGQCLLAATDKGLCALHFVHDENGDDLIAGLEARFANATIVEEPKVTAPYMDRVFPALDAGNPEPLYLVLKGTNLQIRVWKALLEIPPGAVVSYGHLAERAGRPSAVRAVASAVARNPIQYLIPCHRVIRSTGAFGEYQGGAARKRALIAWESARSAGDDVDAGAAVNLR